METIDSPIPKTEDRISYLPETLIHHILSFLHMELVVQTSILSRRWRYIWTSLPTLNFNSNLFLSRVTNRSNRFLDFVDSVLILRDNSDVQRFSLVWHEMNNNRMKSHLKKWILAALRRNVQELSINLVVYLRFTFPPCLFTSSTLRKLELRMDDLYESEIILPISIGLPRLKFLTLRSLSMRDESLTYKLFSCCPALESLIIINSCVTDAHMNLNISSVKLKHVKLDMYGYKSRTVRMVKLDTPNLTSFICKDYMSQDYSLENLSSLVTADVELMLEDKGENEMPETYSNVLPEEKTWYAHRMMEFLKALHHVKDLTLAPGILEVVTGAPHILTNKPTLFLNLRCLKLKTWVSRNCMHAISYLLMISPNVESLFLNIFETKLDSANIGDGWEAGLSFPCMLHHLKFVEIRGVLGSVNELKFLEILLKKAIVLEKVALFNSKANSPARVRQLMKFREKLLTFPSVSSRIAIFFVQS